MSTVKPKEVSSEVIEQKIFLVRGHKVMLDRDLAELYGVMTKNLNKAVRRNIERFPEDFMLELTKEEHQILRFQFGTLEQGKYSKYLPLAFTEQGVAMLSSILNSKQAIHVNIQIMRAFVKLKETMSSHKDLARKFDQLENKVGKHDLEIQAIFAAIRRLMSHPDDGYKRSKIGFIVKPGIKS